MILAVVGPTCSGKSSLAIEIAKFLNAEIVNFDPYQCYKELNIGVAKPTEKEFSMVKHNLFNIVSITEDFTIFEFQKILREKIKSLQNLNKNIVLVGGSGLYLRSAIYDYEFSENKPVNLKTYEEFTNEELLSKLKEVDPISAEKIHVNNRKRLVRALQIFDETGKPKSKIEETQKHESIFDVKFIGLDPDREELYENINKRVDIMYENGLVDEVNYLFSHYDKNLKALQAIGYKEFNIENKDEIKDLIKKNTRNYAKRQMTFFKHQFNDVKWFKNKDDALKYVKDEFHE